MRAAVLTVALTALAGCGATDPCSGVAGACVALTVQSSTVSMVDALQITASGALSGSHGTSGARASLPIHVALKLPASASGALHLAVEGKLAGAVVGVGAGNANVVRGQHTSVTVTLVATGNTVGSDLGGSDLASSDLAGAGIRDLSVPPPDLMRVPDMVFVPSAVPSCVNLLTNCGPGPAGESCCISPVVTGGMFYRESDIGTMAPDHNNPATVSDFRLDKYEVTVGRFRRFVNAGMGTQKSPPAAGSGANPYLANSGWDATWNTHLPADTTALETALQCDATYHTWTTSPTLDNKAINCVSWYEAVAFCAWDGGFLPTEAEWTYAAYGGSDERVYPWSTAANPTTIDCTYANFNSSGGSCNNGVVVVGSQSPKGDGKWGQADLAGNVWEWNLDWFAATFINPCTDCADFDPASSYRVVSGGSYAQGTFAQQLSFRDDRQDPTVAPDPQMGFRCARPK